MLEPISPVNDIFRRDFDLADPTLLDPTSATALEGGEWMTLDSTGKLVRVGATAVPDAFQLFSPKGDTAAQAIGKATIFFLHDYEALTDMFEDGGGGFTIGQYLTAKEVTVDTVTRAGLTQATQGTDIVTAIVTGLPAANDGKLKYLKIQPYFWASS